LDRDKHRVTCMCQCVGNTHGNKFGETEPMVTIIALIRILQMVPGIAYVICSLIGWYWIIRAMFDDKQRETFKKLEKQHQEALKKIIKP
jgi:hypothetical protein